LFGKVSMNLELLFKLLRCHSTPGDEFEVAAVLQHAFTAAGLTLCGHGQYAISAEVPTAAGPNAPRVLVCAHMDSPGFVVESFSNDQCTLVALGGVDFTPPEVDGTLKIGTRKLPVTIHRHCDSEDDDPSYTMPMVAGVSCGDRVCYAAEPQLQQRQQRQFIVAPFLDNRLGCWLLTELAGMAQLRQLPVQLTLAATAGEEFGGFGAQVLARAIAPDLVMVIDATYANRQQNVCLGNGVVLTLADAAVLLSCRLRHTVTELLNADAIAMQTEVYNYSGTDARAFPQQGRSCPVLPLLIASTGNHSPCETIDLADAATTLAAIVKLAGSVEKISRAAALV